MTYPEELRDRIRAQYSDFGSYRAVARLNRMSHITVRRIVMNEYKEAPKKRGPKPKLTARHGLSIKRAAAKITASFSKVTARKLQIRCEMTHVSKRTIC